MFHLVVQHFMDRGDDRGVIKKATSYGTKDPNLWVNVLTCVRCCFHPSSVLVHTERVQP